jgi:uncharacterized membrane protein
VKVDLAAYLTTLAALLGIEFIWLTLSSERLYRPILRDILVVGFRPAPAIVFYLAYAAGLVYFGVRSGLVAESWRAGALNGALFGFFAYATYDLTSHATLRNWTTTLTVVDMTWGTFLSAAAAAIGVAATLAIMGGGPA